MNTVVSIFQTTESLPPNIHWIITSSTGDTQKLLQSTEAFSSKHCCPIRGRVRKTVPLGIQCYQARGITHHIFEIQASWLHRVYGMRGDPREKEKCVCVGGGEWACKSLQSGPATDLWLTSDLWPLWHFMAWESQVCFPLVPKGHHSS